MAHPTIGLAAAMATTNTAARASQPAAPNVVISAITTIGPITVRSVVPIEKAPRWVPWESMGARLNANPHVAAEFHSSPMVSTTVPATSRITAPAVGRLWVRLNVTHAAVSAAPAYNSRRRAPSTVSARLLARTCSATTSSVFSPMHATANGFGAVVCSTTQTGSPTMRMLSPTAIVPHTIPHNTYG